MRQVLSEPTRERLRRLQEDNMPYSCDILAPPSTEAGPNGQPPTEYVKVASNIKCRCDPVQPSEFTRQIAGQTTTKPTWKVSLPHGTEVYLNYTLRIADDLRTHMLQVISKVPHHPNVTAEIFYCSE